LPQFLFICNPIRNCLEVVTNIFISLFLTASISFVAPIMLIGSAIAFLDFVSCVPGFWELGDGGISYILDFLAVFGNDKPLQGMITLGITVSFVGILLDILNLYRNSYYYHSFEDQDLS